VNLPHLGQRPRRASPVDCADAFQKERSIALNVSYRIVMGEAEVERCVPVAGRESSRAGAEAVYQPRQPGENRSAQNLDIDDRLL
jgi:hypothetical protein